MKWVTNTHSHWDIAHDILWTPHHLITTSLWVSMLQCWLKINIGFKAVHKYNMNASLGFIWQWKDKYLHAVPANWGVASIQLACRIQSNGLARHAGSPYFDSYLYSQKLPFLNAGFNHDWLFMHTLDWMLAEIRYHLFMMIHELEAGACRSPIQPLRTNCHSHTICSSALDGSWFT